MGASSHEQRIDEQKRRWMKQIARSIRRESGGRTCGACRWLAGGGSCERPSVLPEWTVSPRTPSAVACKKWEELPALFYLKLETGK